jgi:hypothetical protein
MKTPTLTSDDLARAHAIASRAKCDLRTALRAMQLGVEAIRPRLVREAVTRAIAETASPRRSPKQ